MLITEIVTIDGRQFVYNHSDEDYFIERDGVMYSEAYDPIEFQNKRIYSETLVKIQKDEPKEPEEELKDSKEEVEEEKVEEPEEEIEE